MSGIIIHRCPYQNYEYDLTGYVLSVQKGSVELIAVLGNFVCTNNLKDDTHEEQNQRRDEAFSTFWMLHVFGRVNQKDQCDDRLYRRLYKELSCL